MDKQEYYKIRLEHTSQDTRGYTRLIYMVNGGVLALLYVVIEHGGTMSDRVQIVRGILTVLAAINLFHGLFMFRQRQWYRKIDEEFAQSFGNSMQPVTIGGSRLTAFAGSHAIYAYMHFILALATFFAAMKASTFVPV